MNLLFGVSLILFSIGVLAWAVAGHRLASLPVVGSLVAFVAGFFDGTHNTPKLTAYYADGVAYELVDGEYIDWKPLELPAPDYRPGLLARLINGDHNLPTEDEVSEAPRCKPGLLVEDMLDSHGKPIKGFEIDPAPPRGGLLGWLAGGYNIPTDAEVDALAKWRERHYVAACRRALAAALSSAEKPGQSRTPALVLSRGGVYDLDIFNPMPEAQTWREVVKQHQAVAMVSARECRAMRLDDLTHPFADNPVDAAEVVVRMRPARLSEVA